MNSMVWPFMVETGLISYRSMTGKHLVTSTTRVQAPNFQGPLGSKSVPVGWVDDGIKRPPLPSELLAEFLIFGIFAAIASKDARVGALLGWGIVVATGLTMFGGPAKSSSPTPLGG